MIASPSTLEVHCIIMVEITTRYSQLPPVGLPNHISTPTSKDSYDMLLRVFENCDRARTAMRQAHNVQQLYERLKIIVKTLPRV